MPSGHLDEIIERNNSIANVQVAFVDIEKYSRRRTQMQVEVIQVLTDSLRAAINDVARDRLEYAQANGLNFDTDVIKIPTGDGAAIGFAAFDGLADAHLAVSLALLRRLHEHNTASACDRFETDGWCNCHPYLNVRIGLSEGRSVVYRDVNGAYNLAGIHINLAARLMGLVDRNQIAMSDDAYRQLVDLVDDPGMADHFRIYPARLKHNEVVQVHQYFDTSLAYVNSAEPEELAATAMTFESIDKLRALGMPMPTLDGSAQESALRFTKIAEMLEGMLRAGKQPMTVPGRVVSRDIVSPGPSDVPEEKA